MQLSMVQFGKVCVCVQRSIFIQANAKQIRSPPRPIFSKKHIERNSYHAQNSAKRVQIPPCQQKKGFRENPETLGITGRDEKIRTSGPLNPIH